jgi:D-amino-acid dehydrogenase
VLYPVFRLWQDAGGCAYRDQDIMRICILGGGVIGVTTAYYLAREGHQVTLLERHDRVAQEASFANGAQLSYSYVAPLADPAVLPKLPAWLLSRDSALRFVPQLDIQQWRWCLAFLRACTSAASRAATAQLLSLSFLSRSLLHELTWAIAANLPKGWRRWPWPSMASSCV